MKEKKDNKKVITNMLVVGKQILDLYNEHGIPTEGPKYKEFVYNAGKILIDAEGHEFESYMHWLYSSEGNNLPKMSSGSTYTALEDPDNFYSATEHLELSDDEISYMEDLYKALFN
tara:strand:- start:344 stop:691 length:348 start_codon:yes stop_codon:yes gene_type:complete